MNALHATVSSIKQRSPHSTIKLFQKQPGILSFSILNVGLQFILSTILQIIFPILFIFFFVYKMLEIGKNVHHNEPVSGNVLRHVCSVQ